MIITVTLNAAIDKTLAVPNFRLGWRHRRYGHGIEVEVEVGSLDPADRVADAEVLQIRGFEGRESVRQFPGVIVSHLEAHARAWVRQHGARNFRVALQLPQLLMRQSEADAVLARAGKNLRHRRSDEIVELIDIDPKIPARAFRLAITTRV